MKHLVVKLLLLVSFVALPECRSSGADDGNSNSSQANARFLEQLVREAVEVDNEADERPAKVAYFFVLMGGGQSSNKWRVAAEATRVMNIRSYRDGCSVPPVFRNVVVVEREAVWVVVFARLGNGNKEGYLGFSGSAATPPRVVVLNKPNLEDVTEAHQSEVLAPQVTDLEYSEGLEGLSEDVRGGFKGSH